MTICRLWLILMVLRRNGNLCYGKEGKSGFEKNRKPDKIFLAKWDGALAQLGARHAGSVEVTGSSPVCSIGKVSLMRYFFC